ncbi:MAG: Tad domain-containing protein [Candidatus Gastranaerophilales bacterium]|nr:Tad domain-containing protein [Candidatus Gastranaerophilales bacterium]
MKIFKQRKSGVSLIIVLFGIVAIFAFCSFVVDVAMIMNARAELQKAVETSALVGASSITGELYMEEATLDDNIVQSTFNTIKNANPIIKNAVMNVGDSTYFEKNLTSRAVKIFAELDADTYFAKFIGISKIKIQAHAAAINTPFYLDPDFPKDFFTGSLIDDTEGDAKIQDAVGDNDNLSTSNELTIKNSGENLYGFPDNKAVSLGSGGYITIRLPVPIVDGDGADLYIKELGNLEGYFVFAGIDNNVNNPYISETFPGDGIQWINISCAGTPINVSASDVGAYRVIVDFTDGSSEETKFYGSGYFDLGATCSNDPNNYDASIKSAKYLKIIDDNEEDGFMAKDPTYPVLLLGEHSSITPGADIDAVGILHHSRLIKFSEYDVDSDSDGLIDMLEMIVNPSVSTTDSDSDNLVDDFEIETDMQVEQ